MDIWGALILVLSVIGYLGAKHADKQNLVRLALFFAGVGSGMLVGAVWAYLTVRSIFG